MNGVNTMGKQRLLASGSFFKIYKVNMNALYTYASLVLVQKIITDRF